MRFISKGWLSSSFAVSSWLLTYVSFRFFSTASQALRYWPMASWLPSRCTLPHSSSQLFTKSALLSHADDRHSYDCSFFSSAWLCVDLFDLFSTAQSKRVTCNCRSIRHVWPFFANRLSLRQTTVEPISHCGAQIPWFLLRPTGNNADFFFSSLTVNWGTLSTSDQENITAMFSLVPFRVFLSSGFNIWCETQYNEFVYTIMPVGGVTANFNQNQLEFSI